MFEFVKEKINLKIIKSIRTEVSLGFYKRIHYNVNGVKKNDK